MFFDKYDICEAYFVYMMLWHSGGTTGRFIGRPYTNTISNQLNRMKFKPHTGLGSELDLTENGREIYEQLVEKYERSA